MIQAAPPPAQVYPAQPTDPAAVLVNYDLQLICEGQLVQATSAADFVRRVRAAIGNGPSPPGRAAAYIDGIRTELRQVVAGVPAKDAVRVKVEAVDGQTCRITYLGSDVTTLFEALRVQFSGNMGVGCSTGAASKDSVKTLCSPGHDPGSEVAVQRYGNSPERLTVSVKFTAPAAHPSYYDLPPDTPPR